MRKSLLPLLMVVSACDCGGPPVEDAGPDPEIQLVINELMARNSTVLPDELGEFDDWLELKNLGDEAVSLEGLGLSDDLVAGPRMIFGAQSVPAGGYVVVFADGQPEQGPLHAPFRLSGGGEELVLFDAAGAVVDQHAFGPQIDDVSLGRAPDGTGGFALLANATPGAENDPEPFVPVVVVPDAGPETPPATEVRINEVLALPVDEIEAGLLAPWIELLNTGAAGADLTGHSVESGGVVWPVHPNLSALASSGFLLVVDADPTTGQNHAALGLASAGTVVLRAPDGSVVDTLVYGPSELGISEGILDGGPAALEPTPGAENRAAISTPPDGGPSQNSDAGDAGDAG